MSTGLADTVLRFTEGSPAEDPEDMDETCDFPLTRVRKTMLKVVLVMKMGTTATMKMILERVRLLLLPSPPATLAEWPSWPRAGHSFSSLHVEPVSSDTYAPDTPDCIFVGGVFFWPSFLQGCCRWCLQRILLLL